MVNPPGNPKARFQVAPARGSAGEWLSSAETIADSWWPDYSAWLAERSGGSRAPSDGPSSVGGPGDPAPGRYVLDR
jgi:polyhydroxyalkanoate synthase subunit PhaC